MVSGLVKKFLFLLVVLVIVGLFINWTWGQMQELPTGIIPRGEEGRFMRYMSCAVAMCSGWHRTDGDGCHSGDVVSQELEYEDNVLVKGCRELCEEIRNDLGLPVQERYCGEDFNISFTFQESVTYTSNRSEETNDLRRAAKWKGNFIHSGRCFDNCGIRANWVLGGEGWIYDYEDIHGDITKNLCLDYDLLPLWGCEGWAESGSVWLRHDSDPNFVTTNCEIMGSYVYGPGSASQRIVPNITECEFPAGTKVDIWTENIQDGPINCIGPFGFCITYACRFGDYYACPQVIVSVV